MDGFTSGKVTLVSVELPWVQSRRRDRDASKQRARNVPLAFGRKIAWREQRMSAQEANEREAKWHLHDVQTVSASQWSNMASKDSPFSRSEIQEAIKTQGEIIRQLKLEEQTDEVKKKVKSYCFFLNRFL